MFEFNNIFIIWNNNNKGKKRISYIANSLGKKKHLWQKEWFSDTKRVEFEKLMINIPIGYDQRLKKEYGDYMKIVMGSTQHGDVFFDTEIPYTEYLNEKKEKLYHEESDNIWGF